MPVMSIKTSEGNKALVVKYSQKVFGAGVAQNYIARVAIAYSLALNVKLDLEKDYKDNRGKEYKEYTLMGEREKYYVALVCQKYKIYRTNPDVPKYIKMHLDHGLEMIHQYFLSNPSASGFDFLKEVVQRGINALQVFSYIDVMPEKPVYDYRKAQWDKPAFNEPLRIEIGQPLEDSETHGNIFYCPNNTELHNNLHIAIAGQSGVGKSHFAFKLLRSIYENSNHSVKFVYLDYKGEQPSEEFIRSTGCNIIDFIESKVPFNPLSVIDNVNETSKNYGISTFADIIKDFANLGTVQFQTLKRAMTTAFEQVEKGDHPDFERVYNCVMAEYEDSYDSLTNVLSELANNNIFSSNNHYTDFFNQNYYFKLANKMPNEIKITSIFIVIYFIYNVLMNLPAAPNENNVQHIRYYILIDEAHFLFKSKKSKQLLDRILRTIRSKGVGIILVSQTINEFLDKDFRLSSECDTGFLFQIKDMNLKSVRKFLGLNETIEPEVKKSLENLEQYQVISNLKEYKPGARIQL